MTYYRDDDYRDGREPSAPRRRSASEYTESGYARSRSTGEERPRSKYGDADDGERIRPRSTGEERPRSKHVSADDGERTHAKRTSASAGTDRYGASAHHSASTKSTRASGSGTGRTGNGSHKKKRRKRRRRIRIQPRFFLLLGIATLAIAIVVILISALTAGNGKQSVDNSKTPKPGIFSELFKTPTPSPTPSPSPTPTPTPTPPYGIPHAVEGTEPSKYGIGVKVEVDGTTVETFKRDQDEEIHFGYDGNYTEMKGVITFRGNNLRTKPYYGTVSVSRKKLEPAWSADTGELGRSDVSGPTDRTWTGSGWVGQPLIVEWPEATKQIMNLYDAAKQKQGLVEVIYATMDGCIYFLDLETGQPTRDKLSLGMPFKGAGALDPRGYPILYLGSGDMYVSEAQKSRAMAISLVDFTRLYEFGKQNDPFALRDWHAYDSSPLVDADTDTLIYPGENGILYTIRLNTAYNEAAGTLSMNPDHIVKMRYAGSRSTYPASDTNTFWLGYESSIAMLGGYGYLVTNDGFLQCIDLNTMSIVWVQNVVDDCNGSVVVELDETAHKAYLYVGPSLHWTKNADNVGKIPFMKVDAETGEILWEYEETVMTKSGVSGGIQATALLGEQSISDLVIIPFARTPEETTGKLVALERATGNVRWTYTMEKYTWSSPVAVYDGEGNAYIVLCEGSDTGGKVFLLDGKTGTVLNSFDAEKNIEASPAVYGNMIVIGTRGMKIWGIKIT